MVQVESSLIELEKGTSRPSSLGLVEFDYDLTSGEKFEYYMRLRGQALLAPKTSSDDLKSIQEGARAWIEEENVLDEVPDYANYDRSVVDKKIGGFLEYLRSNHGDIVPEIELEATRAFVDAAFAMYEDRQGNNEVHPEADGTFAFIVPPRMSRKNTVYGEEVEPVIPAFRYLPNELRVQLGVGLPPFIVDVYEQDERGRRGYLVLAPVYGDMMEDLDTLEALRTARANINNTIDFARERLGVEIVGLGATIPALTRFGKEVTNEHVIVTTGHGGTIHLTKEIVLEAIRNGYVDGEAAKKIGVLGLGSIGAPIADLVAAAEFPDSRLHIFDTAKGKIKRALGDLAGRGTEVVGCTDEGQLIDESSIIISAITSRLDLGQPPGRHDLTGKLVIDDSQPGSFDPRQVEQYGGQLTWVIGKDTKGVVVREGYDYGTMANPKRDLFGCEAEAAVLAAYSRELEDRGMPDAARKRILAKIAIREAVTPEKARVIGAMFRKYGIVPSEFQAFGQYVLPPDGIAD